MTLNFGNTLFPTNISQVSGYDFADVLRGNTYISFYAGKINQAEATLNSYEEGQDATQKGNTSTNYKYCQTITPEETIYTTDIYLYLGETGGTNTATISIQETDEEGKPNGTALASASNAAIGTSLTYYLFTLNQTVRLEKDKKYAIVVYLDRDSREPLLGYQYWGYDGSDPTYTGGSYGSTTDGGTTWTMDTTKDFLFKINGTLASKYILFSQEFDSDPESESGLTNLEFETSINNSSIIEGQALINMNTSGEEDMIVKILHERNSARTEIGTNTTSLDTTRKAILIDIAKTKFLEGDKLILKIEAETAFTIQYTDNDATPEENFIIHIPFKTTTLEVN